MDPKYSILLCNQSIGEYKEQINAWLHQNAKKDYSYVILDDEDFFFPKQQEHLVLTDEKEGLTDRKAQKAIWILNS
jgi:hypothetical protein